MTSEQVLSHFREIMTIPRESGHEEHIIAWLQKFAADRNMDCRTDEAGNVLITIPATPGRENAPTLILQSHSDMVCEKNSGVEHDFSKDPIKAVVEDGWLIAKDTTLGADCGIGIAAQLAVLEDKELPHGRIECLFTTSEETGLDGAFARRHRHHSEIPLHPCTRTRRQGLRQGRILRRHRRTQRGRHRQGPLQRRTVPVPRTAALPRMERGSRHTLLDRRRQQAQRHRPRGLGRDSREPRRCIYSQEHTGRDTGRTEGRVLRNRPGHRLRMGGEPARTDRSHRRQHRLQPHPRPARRTSRSDGHERRGQGLSGDILQPCFRQNAGRQHNPRRHQPAQLDQLRPPQRRLPYRGRLQRSRSRSHPRVRVPRLEAQPEVPHPRGMQGLLPPPLRQGSRSTGHPRRIRVRTVLRQIPSFRHDILRSHPPRSPRSRRETGLSQLRPLRPAARGCHQRM